MEPLRSFLQIKEDVSSSTRKLNMKTHIINASIKSLVKPKKYADEMKTSFIYS